MSEENKQEKSGLEKGLQWWTRYGCIPVSIAMIAAITAMAVAILTRIIPEAAAAPRMTTSPTAKPDNVVTVVVTVTDPPSPTFSATSTPTASPTATPTPTLAPIGQHVVQSGETLYCIGRAYEVQPYAIAWANDLVSPSTLHPGQVLKIPAAPWAVIPLGPTCKPQFFSPFTMAASTVTPIPATNTPTTTSTGTATPTSTPTATPTSTATPTATSTPTPTLIPLGQGAHFLRSKVTGPVAQC